MAAGWTADEVAEAGRCALAVVRAAMDGDEDAAALLIGGADLPVVVRVLAAMAGDLLAEYGRLLYGGDEHAARLAAGEMLAAAMRLVASDPAGWAGADTFQA